MASHVASEWGLARARVQNIRQQSRTSSLQSKNIISFRGKFEALDEDGALEVLDSSIQEEKLEMVKIVVESRRNDCIQNLLQRLIKKTLKASRTPLLEQMKNQISKDSDQVDSVMDNMEHIEAYERAVLLATLNDDPETLGAILDWGRDNLDSSLIQERTNSSDSVVNNPILLCSLEQYTSCLTLLYKAGYRVSLPTEDSERISKVLNLNHTLSTSLHMYYTLNKGEKHLWTKATMKKIDKNQRLDPVERYLTFRAHANPSYISAAYLGNENVMNPNKIMELDPIRRSFALSKYAEHLSDYFPEHGLEYQKIKHQCEDFARNLLEQCNHSEEVGVLLDYSPHDMDEDAADTTNWHLALCGEHKDFVSHPYYQHFTWKRMTTSFDWDAFFFIWKVIMFFLAIPLFLCYPFVVIYDSIFRDSNILFISPEKFKSTQIEKKRRASKQLENGKHLELTGPINKDENEIDELFESKIMNFFRERLHRPVYRMFIHGCLEIIFLIFLFLHISDSEDVIWNGDNLHSYSDIITYFFIANYLFEDLVDICRLNWTFFSSLWNMHSLVTNFLLISGGFIALKGFTNERNMKHGKTVNRADFGGSHLINIGMTLISVGACMSYFRTVRWLLLHKKIGPVIICIIRVIKDVVYVFIIFLITYIAFSVGLWSMFKPFQNCQEKKFHYCINETKITKNRGFRGVMSLMFWKVFDGDFSSMEVFEQEQEQENSTQETIGKEFSLEFSHVMGLTFFALYQGLTVILMINILIAMMNSTYSEVWGNSDREWKYSKSYYQIQFLRPQAAFPPPFRWFYYFALFMRKIKSQTAKKQFDIELESLSKKKQYVELMMRLVKTKMHTDVEISIRDDFDDLRKDIKNIIDTKDVIESNQEAGQHFEMRAMEDKLANMEEENHDLKKKLQNLEQKLSSDQAMTEELKKIKDLLLKNNSSEA